MTAINRRSFLKLVSLSSCSALAFAMPLAHVPLSQTVAFASAYTTHDDAHYIALLDDGGQVITSIPVESRGHSAAYSNNGRFIAFFARRPRRWLVVVDVDDNLQSQTIEVQSGRHFFGHGVFSADGRYLYTTENDYENNRGVIGIYDVADNLNRVGELPSFGIGPHEIAMLSDDRTLVIANGGIETHPDYGRRKLNLSTMDPTLTYVDRHSGKHLTSVRPPDHQLSLRHLAVTKHDQVIVGAQYQGPKQNNKPLVFSHQIGHKLEALSGQQRPEFTRLNQYIASVAITTDGQYAVTSSPRGDIVSVWDIQTNRWVRDVSLPDVGGVAPQSGMHQVLVTSGNGSMNRLNAHTGEYEALVQHEKIYWDNHLITG